MTVDYDDPDTWEPSAEKKSNGCAVSEKAQAAAVRRDVVRQHIAALATEIMDQVDFSQDMQDDPEGTVKIHVTMSLTLAEDMLESLRAAEVMI